MAISAFKRYEIKFMLNREQLEAIIPRLMTYMNPDAYCRNGNYYTIYNIYYDTLNNDVIRHSLSKPYYKEKLRLRSYKIPTSPDAEVFLELKKKIGSVVNKRRAVLSLKAAYDFIEFGKRPVVSGYMNNQVINELEHYLDLNKVYPAAFISYQRMAFFGKEDKNFRITFDSNIKTRRTNLRLEKGSYGTQLIEGRYLMEVKISEAVPMWLSELLSELQVYKTSFSKYGTEYQNYCSLRNENRNSLSYVTDNIISENELCVNY